MDEKRLQDKMTYRAYPTEMQRLEAAARIMGIGRSALITLAVKYYLDYVLCKGAK